ncbi:MAG: hypothetical protein JWL79_2125 [Frankiales bacterium]|nr:hypothetical protein [Frankiales bacterium]
MEIGDFWAVELADGRYGAAQVRDLQGSGVGALTTFVMGVVDWSGEELPGDSDLVGRTVLDQGLARIDVFTKGGAKMLGNSSATVTGPGLTSVYRDHGVGTVTSVWGWKGIPRVVERALACTR